MILISIDVGLSSGVCVVGAGGIRTYLFGNDLPEGLEKLRDTLQLAGGFIESAVAERPLLGFRGGLSRDLENLCRAVELVLPQVHWILAPAWKQQKGPLRAFAEARHPEAWRNASSVHEKDALLMALWSLDVLAPPDKK